MHDDLVRQYRAELHDENGITVITSANLTDAQRKIHNLLDDDPRFEQSGTQTQIVMDRKGGKVLGWITEQEVPYSLSVSVKNARKRNDAESEQVPAVA